MDGARDELLARPALADDEDRGCRGRDVRHGLVDGEHRRRRPDDLRDRRRVAAAIDRWRRSRSFRRAIASATMRFSSVGSIGLAR